MKCRRIRLDNGAVAIVCGGHVAVRYCACGRPATHQCDFKEPHWKNTCSRHVCRWCAFLVGADKDICRAHIKRYNEQQRQGTLAL